MKYVFSAPPSKLRAKALLGAIWILAAILATPMAVALNVTYVEENDHGKYKNNKFWTAAFHPGILSTFSFFLLLILFVIYLPHPSHLLYKKSCTVYY